MASPKIAVDIRDYLVNTASISPTTVDMLAPTPIAQYAVIEYSGPSNIKTHGGSSPGSVVLDEGMIQVQARHGTNQTARTNIMSVVDALDGLRDTTINGTVYTWISLVGRPRFFGKAEDGSTTFIAEFRVQARR